MVHFGKLVNNKRQKRYASLESIMNKRPMGHYVHLRNQFKSTHMIISYHRLEEENTHSFVWNWMVIVLHLTKLKILFTQGCFVPILFEISPVILKKNFLKFHQCILLFQIISPWKRLWPFIWPNLNPHHPRMLCAKFGWYWPSGSGEEDEKCEKFTTTSMMTTDNRQIVIRKAHFSL